MSVSGQGTILFANNLAANGAGAPVYDVDGKTPLAGPEFLAELYAGPLGGSMAPISSSITPFLSSLPGYFFNAGDVAVPGVPSGGTAMVQVMAWRASDGATFATANHPEGHIGNSSVFEVVALGGGPGNTLPDPTLTGMRSFSLYVVVPEPTVLSLMLVGGVSLICWLRRDKPD